MSKDCADKLHCLWADSIKFCDTLRRAGIPLDDKWPMLILYLRGVGEHPMLSEEQKLAAQNLLLSIFKEGVFDDSVYYKSFEAYQSIITAPIESELQLLLKEVDSLAGEMLKVLGRQTVNVKQVTEHLETDLARNVAPEEILAGIRSSLKQLAVEMEAESSALKELSQIDYLTGLANRRVLDAFLDESIELWKKDKTPLSIIMIDVDLFKRLNDTYGHLIGDQVLQLLAKQMKEACSYAQDDHVKTLAARYGGEEFMIAVRGDKSEAAKYIAEQLRIHVYDNPLTIEDVSGIPLQVNISISLGVAHLGKHWSSAFKKNLIEVADKALYHAKSSGRNLTAEYIASTQSCEVVVL